MSEASNIEFTTIKSLNVLDGVPVEIKVSDGERYSGVFSIVVDTATVSIWDGQETRDFPLDDIIFIKVL